MKLLKNNRRKNRIIKRLHDNWMNCYFLNIETEEERDNYRSAYLRLVSSDYERSEQEQEELDRLYKENKQLLNIKDKYYKLLSAIKITES